MIRLDELPSEVREVVEAAVTRARISDRLTACDLCDGLALSVDLRQADYVLFDAARRLAAKMEEKPCE